MKGKKTVVLRVLYKSAAVFLAAAAVTLLISVRTVLADGAGETASPTHGGPRAESAGGNEGGELPAPLPADLQSEIDGIQARYEKLVDFKAQFVQESRLQAASTGEGARGEVFFQKPGKMRWSYKSPDVQEILIRDGTFWQYVPEDDQVVIQRMDTSRVEYAFLTGLGELETQFNIRWDDPRRRPGDPLLYLALVPKDEQASFAEARLGVDGEHRILVTEVTDFLGNVTVLRFEKLEDNVGVGNEHFEWKNPSGADVIDMTAGFKTP